jgi:hypothetical protein
VITHTYKQTGITATALPAYTQICGADPSRFILSLAAGGGGPHYFRPVGPGGTIAGGAVQCGNHTSVQLKWRDIGPLVGYVWEAAATVAGGGQTSTEGSCHA